LGYVLSENGTRRHLTAGQKAMIAEKIAKLPRGRPNNFEELRNYSQADAAVLMGAISRSALQTVQSS
jgi:hypothetical protein